MELVAIFLLITVVWFGAKLINGLFGGGSAAALLFGCGGFVFLIVVATLVVALLGPALLGFAVFAAVLYTLYRWISRLTDEPPEE